MCDVVDRSNEQQEVLQDAALARRVRYTGVSPLVCECGEPIPEARRRALPGVLTCIDCAIRQERR